MTANLFTETTRYKLLENGQLGNKDEAFDPHPVVKLFATAGAATWLLTEIDPENPDIAFGLCDLGLGFAEFGTVSLSEMTRVYNIEVDRYFEAEAPISRYAEKAQKAGRIIEFGIDRSDDPSRDTPTPY